MDENSKDFDLLKAKVKEELRKELKKELLKEIYQELRAEESENVSTNSKKPVITEDLSKSVAPIESVTPKGDEKVTISVPALLKIASHARKYANEKIPRDRWVEVIGLLAGTLDRRNDKLTIEDVYPMGHGNAVYAEIKDYKNYVRAFTDLKKKGHFICGWYHSHPSYGLFLSDEDMGTQSRYQKLWDQAVALVMDPYMIDGTSYGFNIFQANLRTRKWFPVSYDIKGNIDVRTFPQLLQFIDPIIDGKAIYLEYDEDN